MGEVTGIAWTDSTMNWWEGCTKVGPGCDNCYAEDRDNRYHAGAHWGPGAPRRQMTQHTRNNPMRWQRAAEDFKRLRGHPQRVFASSLSDMFDNEVPDEWRAEAFAAMEATPGLRWQICTKRVSNVEKMVPVLWRGTIDGVPRWPRNVGLLITTVTGDELRRDVPRLISIKQRYSIPWVGLSIEPMVEDIAPALSKLGPLLTAVDWVILGGESGPHARPCDVGWIISALGVCFFAGVHCFVKQLGAKPLMDGQPVKLADAAGKNPAEWPADHLMLNTREFPRALC